MNSLAIFLTVCLGLASAANVKRQALSATPPAPTAPPTNANNTAMMTDVPVDAAVTTEQVTVADSNDTTTPPMMVDTSPKTTKKPTIDEIVTVEEIFQVFTDVSKSDFFKNLPLDQQLIVLEILAGGETAKMTPVLEQMVTRKLLEFLYNIPFKHSDSLWRLINLGYTREDMVN